MQGKILLALLALFAITSAVHLTRHDQGTEVWGGWQGSQGGWG